MKKNNIGTILIVSILLSFICGSLGAYIIVINTEVGYNIIQNITKSEYKETSISNGVENVYDAVVVVQTYKEGNIISTGTGFVYKKDKTNDYAYIMTNNHVIAGYDEVKVILSNNEVIEAEVKGGETYSDIAVLAVPEDKVLSVVKLGKYENMNTGDTVFTIGSPEGAEYFGTVTKGVLSGKERLVAVAYDNTTISDYYMKVMQTDAAINPGNSGGPICNINGDVIGVTNMKLVKDAVEGMGFAIPIEDALQYATMLETDGKIIRPFIGISMIETNNDLQLYQNGIILPSDITEGVVIIEVSSDSPASKAGLKKGDVILELEGEPTRTIAEFRYVLYKHAVGETVKIKYIKNGKVKTTKLKLNENSN